MINAAKNNNYDLALISKIKEMKGSKIIKKIARDLRNLEKENTRKLSELKIKIFEEEKEVIKEPEFKIIAPIIRIKNYFENLKKSNSNVIVNNNASLEGKNITSIVEDNEEELKQIDSSDFSADE